MAKNIYITESQFNMLRESAGDLEYHFTLLENLCGMMETDTINLTETGYEEGRNGLAFLSLSRLRNSSSGYGWGMTRLDKSTGPIARIEFDGRKLNNVRSVNVKPYNYFYNNISPEERNGSSGSDASEFEDSLTLKDGRNQIVDAIDYITRIDVYLSEYYPKISVWERFLKDLETFGDWAEKIHFFTDLNGFDFQRNEIPKAQIYGLYSGQMKQALEENNKMGKRIYITENQLERILLENELLTEAVNKVDNFNLIGDLINITDQDKFFFVQIVKRWKDNKDKQGADAWRQQGRNANTYHKGGDFGNFASGTAFKVRSKQELLALKPQIVQYCDANNARAYITSNPRSESQINQHLAKLQSKFGNRLNPWDKKFGFEHMAGQAKRYGPDWPDRVRLMLDIDTEENTWYIPASKSKKFHTITAKSGKSYIDDRGFPQLKGVEVRYAKHGAQTLVAKYPNQEAAIKALGGINVWEYTHQALQQNGIPIEKEYNTPSNGLHIIIADVSKIQNLDQVEDDLRIFDDGVNENMTQLVHFNFDGKLILYSNVDTSGY